MVLGCLGGWGMGVRCLGEAGGEGVGLDRDKRESVWMVGMRPVSDAGIEQ